MAEPALVARGVAAMAAATRLPVTIKTRIGIDHRDSYDELNGLVRRLADAGARSFAIHARKAWLNGLSPKENREIPPLCYERVHRLKADNPRLEIVLNGGIESLDQAAAALAQVDGVMIGRAAYHNPYMLAEADRRIFREPGPPRDRAQVVEALLSYAERALREGVRLHGITRHILGLFQGVPGAKAWRRHLSTAAHRPGAGVEVIRAAMALVPAGVLPVGPQPPDDAAASGAMSAAGA